MTFEDKTNIDSSPQFVIQPEKGRYRIAPKTLREGYKRYKTYNVEKSLSVIAKHTERMADNSAVIAHNTAVNAYYSKVNAELTNSMGYLMAYKL